MESSAASDLLLRAAGEPAPWDSRAKKSASAIAEILGCLPLALVQAGKAVLKRRCSLHDFDSYFRRTRQRVINARSPSRSGSRKAAVSDTEISVFATYEMLYRGLAEKGTTESANAIELLHMFAFFHREDIREDILLRAVKNPLLERQARGNAPSQSTNITLSSKSLKTQVTDLFVYLFRLTKGPPVLPRVLRDVEDLDDLHEDQIRAALSELSALSLLIYNASNHSYYIHPLVHTWIRERPEMKTAEQAVWCQAAATTLARSIILPIEGLGSSEEDADYRRSILLHIDHVRKCQENIRAQIIKNQRSRVWLWPVPAEKLDDRQAGQIARFSLVYAECSQPKETEQLQRRAKDFFCDLLGIEHPISRLLQIGLSRTYWLLGRPAEAAQLQSTVRDVFLQTKGPEAHETLRMIDMLGKSRLQQGLLKEAMALHKAALDGMSRSLGRLHHDTLTAMSNLAAVYSNYFEYGKVRELLEESSKGLFETLGPSHPETLIVQENLAMVYVELGGDLIEDARVIMIDVLAERKRKLGREHPYTLLAMCHLARAKSALGEFKEAETLMHDGLAIAKRNLGEIHIGTLYGRVLLGRVLLAQGRYRETEDVFLDTIKKYGLMSAARSGEHPDRINAMSFLIDCYREQNKIPEAIAVSERALVGARTISQSTILVEGQHHPLLMKLNAGLDELQATQRSSLMDR
jgi:tetratricopeptide (TPR) repeat protein